MAKYRSAATFPGAAFSSAFAAAAAATAGFDEAAAEGFDNEDIGKPEANPGNCDPRKFIPQFATMAKSVQIALTPKKSHIEHLEPAAGAIATMVVPFAPVAEVGGVVEAEAPAPAV